MILPDALINYSSRAPLKKSKHVGGEKTDTETTPTPVRENCRNIAWKLASALHEKEFLVRVKEAPETNHRNQILNARLIVIDSPSYVLREIAYNNNLWPYSLRADCSFWRCLIYSRG